MLLFSSCRQLTMTALVGAQPLDVRFEVCMRDLPQSAKFYAPNLTSSQQAEHESTSDTQKIARFLHIQEELCRVP
jgi:hypothetical protein